jgi:hypothetical protein
MLLIFCVHLYRLPASIFLVFLLTLASWLTLCVAGVLVLGGFALHPLLETARRRGWCEFEEMTADHWSF